MNVARRKRPSQPELKARAGAHVRPGEPAEPPRRGRPARLSRQRILDSVRAILEREPNAVPTIATIAREVEAVPAALYRHFESLEDILDGVMAEILAASQSPPRADVPWQRQLERWMRELRVHLLRYPAILAMIGRSGRTSPAWLEASSALVGILARAGLAERELALTYLWVLETTVGLVLQEAMMPLCEQIENARAARGAFSAAARERFAPIERELGRIDEDAFFEFAVARTIAVIGLREQAARERLAGPAPRRR